MNHPARLAPLDTLRSLAILSVIAYHLYVFSDLGAMPHWLQFTLLQGWMGVDLFFVLSGYLIGTQFLRPAAQGEEPSLGGFYRDRALRILPAYLAVLALYLLLPGWRETEQMAPAWKFLTFTENILPGAQMTRSFSHAWSLCVEQHFYLVFPLLALSLLRRPSVRRTMALLAGVALLGILLRGFVWLHLLLPLGRAHQSFGMDYMAYLYYPTYCRLDGLLTGVTLATLQCFRPALWQCIVQHANLCLLGGLVLLAASVWMYADRWSSVTGVAAVGVVFGPLVLSCGLGFCLLASLSNGLAAQFRIPGARQIALLAYTLYLTHKQMIHLVDLAFPWLHDWNRAAWTGVYLLFCLAASLTLYLGAERPFLRLRTRLRRSPRQQAVLL